MYSRTIELKKKVNPTIELTKESMDWTCQYYIEECPYPLPYEGIARIFIDEWTEYLSKDIADVTIAEIASEIEMYYKNLYKRGN